MLGGLLSDVFRIAPVGICALCLLSLVFGAEASGDIQPQNVLVLFNADQGVDGAGYQIADYYRQARPGVHVVGLSGINDILAGSYGELVTADNYLNVIRPQVLSAIGSIPDSIDVIVTTKGLPLKVDAGVRGADSQALVWKRFSSLESELTRISAIDTVDRMGDQFYYSGFPDIDPTRASNPYYADNGPFAHEGSDPINGDIHLAARLDGYDVPAVKQIIDRSQQVFVVPRQQYFVLDDDPNAGADQMIDVQPGGPGPGLVNVLETAQQAYHYENTNAATTAADGPVVGYVSHGTADGTGGLENGYIANQLAFEPAPGAIFLTHESWNAGSFDPSHVQSQGSVAEWFAFGGTAGLGHVHEPYNGPDNIANEDLLFDALLPAAAAQPGESGLTFVEAAWNSIRQLSYVNTVVGDPLMRWRRWLPGDSDLSGQVDFHDFFSLQGNWLQPGSYAEGDFSGDGFVDANDFEILQENWLASVDGVPQGLATPPSIQVTLKIDDVSGMPALCGKSLAPTNLDGDIDVDSDDLAMLLESYGVDAGGDADGDGETSGLDFLIWQRQFFKYDFEADFNLDAQTNEADLSIWDRSYGKNLGGDADGDGDTDGLDFLKWQIEQSKNLATEQVSTALTPEPSSLGLLLLGIALQARSWPTRRARCSPRKRNDYLERRL